MHPRVTLTPPPVLVGLTRSTVIGLMMATEDQVGKLITLLETQMTTLAVLTEENKKLREGAIASPMSTPHMNTNTKARSHYRPVINVGMNNLEWEVVRKDWSWYKLLYDIDDTDVEMIQLELRLCCSAEINRLMFECFKTALFNVCSEEELLGHMKSVAVKSAHIEVHTMAFNAMVQEKGESITHFVERLTSKAISCGFEVDCLSHYPPIMVSYADKMIEQRLVAGLYNPEHQRCLLLEASSLTILEAKVKRLQVLEVTGESFVKPTFSVHTETTKSVYKKPRSKPSKRVVEAGTKAKHHWCPFPSFLFRFFFVFLPKHAKFCMCGPVGLPPVLVVLSTIYC